MFLEKYPINSDFVQSFIKTYFIGKVVRDKSRILDDAEIYKNCVHMNQTTLNLADCWQRKENVDNYIAHRSDFYKRFYDIATENCKNELLAAYSSELAVKKANTTVEQNLNLTIHAGKLNIFNDCLKKHILEASKEKELI